MSPDDLTSIIIGVIAAVGAILVAILAGVGTVVAAYVKVRPILRSLKEDTERVRHDTAKVRHEVEYNSGSSMKDAMRRIEGRQESAIRWQDGVTAWMREQERINRAQASSLQELRERSEETHQALAERITAVDERTQP